ncbi:MAG: DNA replication and repair protein RecF [Bacteroidota bacterium]
MILKSIKYQGYKNLMDSELIFSDHINTLSGLNGVGKTNILDAIHYLSLAKSAFGFTDSQTIAHGKDVFYLEGRFQTDEKSEKISCAYKEGQKKILRADAKEYKKLSDHVGKYPVVMFNPYDTDIIRSGGESRRRFVDSILSQINTDYLRSLIAYNSILRQKNQFLKNTYHFGQAEHLLLDTYDHKMAVFGTTILKTRKTFITDFKENLVKYYDLMSSSQSEIPDLLYDTGIRPEDIKKSIADGRKVDINTKRSSTGTHKDDFIFNLNGRAIKKFGSQGQQKSYSIALRLAQHSFITQKLEYKPLLLFDDLFDKLDRERIERLMKFVVSLDKQQIFITDTSLSRLRQVLMNSNKEVKHFRLDNGIVQEVT